MVGWAERNRRPARSASDDSMHQQNDVLRLIRVHLSSLGATRDTPQGPPTHVERVRVGSRVRIWRRAATLSVLCSALLGAGELRIASAQALGAMTSATPKPAAPKDPLARKLRQLLDKSQLADHVALSIADAQGRELFVHRDSVAQNPASNLKLLTAAVALIELGPEFRARTSLFGRTQAEPPERSVGGVCLKGYGDPTLTRAELAEFAHSLRDAGVREIDEVFIDGSYFDDQVLPPAFEQQPEESAPFRAAVAALSVNANAYTLHLRPGPSEGALANLASDSQGYLVLNNQLTTAAPGSALALRVTERDLGEQLEVSVLGSIARNHPTQTIARRVPSPLHYAGQVFIETLRAAGLQPPERARLARCASDLPLIATHESPPLWYVLSRLGKDSDNFAAEMLLKTLAAEHTHRPGRSDAGVNIVIETLQRLSLPAESLQIVNGSGLFQGNLVTTQLLSQLLLHMYRSPIREEFISQLAVGGADGTLAKRFRNLPGPRSVRAKTGTLNDVIALSGYVLGPTPERAYIFSYIANGVAGKQNTARELADRIVTELSAQLYKRPAAAASPLKRKTPADRGPR